MTRAATNLVNNFVFSVAPASSEATYCSTATLDNAVYHHKLGTQLHANLDLDIFSIVFKNILFWEMTLQSLYYKSLTVRKSQWIPTSWQCKILARWNIGTKVLCISFGFFCIMWDLLLAFHAYIRQPEIYGEESIIFLNRKLKKI